MMHLLISLLFLCLCLVYCKHLKFTNTEMQEIIDMKESNELMGSHYGSTIESNQFNEQRHMEDEQSNELMGSHYSHYSHYYQYKEEEDNPSDNIYDEDDSGYYSNTKENYNAMDDMTSNDNTVSSNEKIQIQYYGLDDDIDFDQPKDDI